MVIKTAKNGLQWEEPPYTWKRLREIEAGASAAPVGIARGPIIRAPDKQPPQPGKSQSSATTKAGGAD